MDTRSRVDTVASSEAIVPPERLWGEQTRLSLHFFAIGQQRMPLALIHALGWVKWSAACVNRRLGRLGAERAQAIADAAEQVALGRHDGAFPLSVWQTGSGTHSHMNVNEVVARLADAALQRRDSAAAPVDAHDEVNLGQSTNDVFPTAMHLAVALQARERLLPALDGLRAGLRAKAGAFEAVIKVGRTHGQDATPVTLGQEFGGYRAQLDLCRDHLLHSLAAVHALAIGGTAVGTGLNTHARFGPDVAAQLAHRFNLPLVQADNLFAAMAGHEALVGYHSALKMLAIALMKIGNDIRWMGSGPRAGLGELRLPANEPGSSIMPGKVNPSQIEALLMVCMQVMGHDTAVGLAASQGQFELNACKPLIALNTLDSGALLADAMHGFMTHCVAGIEVDRERVSELLGRSLMTVTALTPHIGYDRAALIAQRAQAQGLTLREAALADGAVSPEQFDAWADPRHMLGPLEP